MLLHVSNTTVNTVFEYLYHLGSVYLTKTIYYAQYAHYFDLHKLFNKHSTNHFKNCR